MKNELGITKGEWVYFHNGNYFEVRSNNGLTPYISIFHFNKSEFNGIDEVCEKEEAEANAKLIAEAGTVANETGKTPRQLADDNKVLLEALQNMRVMYWQWIEQHPETQGYKWAKEALSAIKQVTE